MRGSVFSVAFSPDSKYVASGSYDKTIKIWDTLSWEVNTLQGHTELVSSIAFSPDGRYIASGSLDEKVKIWDIHPLTAIDQRLQQLEPHAIYIKRTGESGL